jgi:hypothetical protein
MWLVSRVNTFIVLQTKKYQNHDLMVTGKVDFWVFSSKFQLFRAKTHQIGQLGNLKIPKMQS